MRYFYTILSVPVLIAFLVLPNFSLAQEEEKRLIPCGYEEGGEIVECSFGHLIQLVGNIIDFLTFTLAFPLAAALFAYAGILMITAGGKEEQIKKAKGVFWHVAVGLLIMLAAWLIVYTITNTLLDDSFILPVGL